MEYPVSRRKPHGNDSYKHDTKCINNTRLWINLNVWRENNVFIYDSNSSRLNFFISQQWTLYVNLVCLTGPVQFVYKGVSVSYP